MSADITPAIERANAAQREKAWRRRHPDIARSLQYDHGWVDAMADTSLSAPDWPARDQAMIRAALAAALDVEDMARVLHGNPGTFDPATCTRCADTLRQAKELRTALLGADS